MSKLKKRTLILCLIIVTWLAASACSCSDLLANLGERGGATKPTATLRMGEQAGAEREQTVQARSATATPVPSATHTLVPTLTPRAAPAPTQTPPDKPVVPLSDVTPGIPTTPNTPFDVTLTEARINAYAAGQVVSESGVEVSDPQITLGDGEALVHLTVYHEVSNLRLGLTVRGAPVVYEGGLYVRVDEVLLDDTVKGLTRLLARTVIDAALKQYAGEHGIAIPVEQVVFERVDVTPGAVRVVGRTR